MGVATPTVTLTFSDQEIDDLLADGWTTLNIYRLTWAVGRVGLNEASDYAAPAKTHTIVDGTLTYEWEDLVGTADTVYEWAPYTSSPPTLGPLRPAFTAGATSGLQLLRELGRRLDPLRFLRSTITGSSATNPIDTNTDRPDDFFNGCYLLPEAGNYSTHFRRITDWVQSTSTYTVSPAFGGATGTVDYLVLPMPPPVALDAIRAAIRDMWPRRGRRVVDESLSVAAGEKAFDIPAPIRTVEMVEYLASGATVATRLKHESLGNGQFRLWNYPSVGTTLRVTGLAPYSDIPHLNAITELADPLETEEVLLAAEIAIRKDAASGLQADAAEIARLEVDLERERRRHETHRRILVHPPIL